MRSNKVYLFDNFSLDANAKVLMRGGAPVTITRKAVETLLALAENSGRVMSKEDLLKTIWPDRVVDDANLTQNIAMVRRALGVNRDSAAYIETFPGRGYRLVGPVTVEELTPPTDQTVIPAKAENNGQPPQPELSLTAPPVLDSGEIIAPEAPPKSHKNTVQKASFAAVAVLVLSGVILGYVFFQRRAAKVNPEFRVFEVTHLRGMESQPAISPHAKQIAFIWQQENEPTPNLYVQSAATAKDRWVSVVPGHYSSPTWSPDANTLAYLRVSNNATQVVVIPMRADEAVGQERIVTQFSPPDFELEYRRLDWSPDGQSLVVSHSEAIRQPYSLFLVNVATGEKRRLTTPEGRQGGDVAPRFSPSGKSISFIRYLRREHQELYTVPVTGGAPQPITDDRKRISDLDWSGNDLIFASNRSGEFRLWRRPAGSNNELQRLEFFSNAPIRFSIAEQTPTLVYSTERKVRNLWEVDLVTHKWKSVVASTENSASPQYSPDGKQICFRSDRSGDDQLWVCNADSSNQIQLTRAPLSPNFANWSADSQQLVFQDQRSGHIHTASFINGSWEVNTTGVTGHHPVFSPDGKLIYARMGDSLVKISADSSHKIEVVLKDVRALAPRFSPDGKRLFFFKDDPQATGLWQLTMDSGDVRLLLTRLLPDCMTCWAPAPDGIYYLGMGESASEGQAIYFHPFKASGPDQLVAKYPEPLSPATSGPFSLSPDFRNFLCVRMQPIENNVMQVEPFR